MIEDIPHQVDVETASEKFKCPKCDFETKNQNRLKIHMKRKHKRDTKTCDLCNQLFETAREMKMHRNIHSYECEFTCETIESIEVHIGKCCYNYFECGLCEVRVENLEQ